MAGRFSSFFCFFNGSWRALAKCTAWVGLYSSVHHHYASFAPPLTTDRTGVLWYEPLETAEDVGVCTAGEVATSDDAYRHIMLASQRRTANEHAVEKAGFFLTTQGALGRSAKEGTAVRTTKVLHGTFPRRRALKCGAATTRTGPYHAPVGRRSSGERCALAGDQVGQGHAVGCEAGKLCELVDTVLKKGVQAPAGRNT